MRRLFFLFASLLLLGACTKVTDVPSGKHAFTLRLGHVQQVVSGPAQIDSAPMLDNIIFIDELHTVELNNSQYSIRYRVVDPVQYYLRLGGNHSIFYFVQDQLATLALNGKSINSQDELYDLIEGLKLPIELLRDAPVSVPSQRTDETLEFPA